MVGVNIFSTVERTDPSPAGHGNSHFEFIDRVVGPHWDQVRGLIEDLGPTTADGIEAANVPL
jgi:hypothetical protein